MGQRLQRVIQRRADVGRGMQHVGREHEIEAVLGNGLFRRRAFHIERDDSGRRRCGLRDSLNVRGSASVNQYSVRPGSSAARTRLCRAAGAGTDLQDTHLSGGRQGGGGKCGDDGCWQRG